MNIIILILVCASGIIVIAWTMGRSGRNNPMRELGMQRQRQSEVNMQAVNRDEILRLLTTKQKISAIKMYREMTGAGLREAKEAVELMERELAVGSLPVEEGGGSDIGGSDGGWQGSGDAGELMLEIRGLLRAGNKIAAIKLYREKTGASLSQAKAAIDELDAFMRYSS